MDQNEQDIAILGTLFASLMEDKEEVIKVLIGGVLTHSKISEGLKGTLERFDTNNTPEHRERQLKSCIKFLQQSMELNSQLSLILLAYASGGSMAGDSAQVLTGLGFGDYAIKQMFKDKLGKKGYDDIFKGNL